MLLEHSPLPLRLIVSEGVARYRRVVEADDEFEMGGDRGQQFGRYAAQSTWSAYDPRRTLPEMICSSRPAHLGGVIAKWLRNQAEADSAVSAYNDFQKSGGR
jgi:hypothetical protein